LEVSILTGMGPRIKLWRSGHSNRAIYLEVLPAPRSERPRAAGAGNFRHGFLRHSERLLSLLLIDSSRNWRWRHINARGL